MKSGELRQAFPQNERIETRPPLSESERALVSAIQERIAGGKSTTLGEGQSADVMILHIWNNAHPAENPKPWVVKREQRRTKQQEYLDTNMRKEFSLHQTAYRLIENQRTPTNPLSRLPEPLSIIEDNNTQWLLMEYIDGETLFERSLKEYLHSVCGITKEELQPKRRKELLQLLVTNQDSLAPEMKKILQQFENNRELVDERIFPLLITVLQEKKVTFLSVAQIVELRNTINTLNQKGYYHRDLHPSNIMLCPDGRTAIIDFGLATIDEAGPHLSQDYREKTIYKPEITRGFDKVTVELTPDTRILPYLIRVKHAQQQPTTTRTAAPQSGASAML